MVRLTLPQTMGTMGFGNRVRTGSVTNRWQPNGGNSVHTRPNAGTGSRNSGGHGRRFTEMSELPGSIFPSARSTADESFTVTLRRSKKHFHTLEMNWGLLSDTISSGIPKYQNTCWMISSVDSIIVGKPLRGIRQQDLENRTTTTNTHVLPEDCGRSLAGLCQMVSG